MNPHYNQNYTKEEINVVLDKMKSCVGNNKYTIALNENRQEMWILLMNTIFVAISKKVFYYNLKRKISVIHCRIQNKDTSMRFYMFLSLKYNYLMRMV